MIELTGQIIDQYKDLKMRIRLSEIDYFKLKKKLIQYKILASNQNLNQLSQEIGISTKNKYIKAQIQILFKFNDLSIIKKMLDNRHFPLIYNYNKIKKGDKHFPDHKQTIYNFGYNKIVAVKIQIYSQNFRTFN